MNMIEFWKGIGAEMPESMVHEWRHRGVNVFQDQPCPDVEPIHRVVLDGDMDVVISRGAPRIVIAGTDEKAINQVRRALLMGTLRLSREPQDLAARAGVKIGSMVFGDRPAQVATQVVVAIRLPFIPQVSLEGSGNVYVYDVDQEELGLYLKQDGKITCFGKVNVLGVQHSGRGIIDSKGLWARRCWLSLAGSGELDAHAAEEVVARLTGSGNIRISGNPTTVSETKNGRGTVTCL